MLNENIKMIRKAKGLSQDELASKLNVVRQTVSKWEQGLSVPDADLLIALSEALETPISTLLGENVTIQKANELSIIAEKLEIINLQLANRKQLHQKIWHHIFLLLSIFIIATFFILLKLKSPYLTWDLSDPETAVFRTFFHAFEFLFIRLAPIALIATICGFILTKQKK